MILDKETVRKPHHNEELVPCYTLPDPLKFEDGSKVTKDLWSSRKIELKDLFRNYLYGNPPDLETGFKIKVIREVPIQGLDGAKRRDMELEFFNGEFKLPVILFLPNLSNTLVPTFVGLNFQGNHSVHPDPTIDIPKNWVADRPDLGSNGNKASYSTRGMHASAWPIELILSRGYALITAQYNAVAPDNEELFKSGIQKFEKSPRDESSAGAISIWAWAYSRLRDVLDQMPETDGTRAITVGHSRLGKTSLWAAAEDDKFAMSVSIQSGLNGAKLNRRCYGARFENCLVQAPYWLVPKLFDYIDKEQEFPIDQHELISLIAPRPVYVSSASDDWWCDPKGEFLACVHANPVYELLGQKGICENEMPPPNISVGNKIGYHIRPGEHSVLPVDWWHILNFADRNL